MVSRRNLFVSLMMMGVLFVLFQFSLVMKDQGNSYDVNAFASTPEQGEQDVWSEDTLVPVEEQERDYIVYIGDEKEAVYDTIREWCLYRKMNRKVYATVQDYEAAEAHPPLAILFDGEHLDIANSIAGIEKLQQNTVPLFFCSLPDVDTMEQYPEFMSLLGIDWIESKSVEVVGYHLFEGFLLGGESYYRVDTEEDEMRMDLDRNIPLYHVFRGSKVYMVGMYEEVPEQTEDQPPLLWRYSNRICQTFVVNGDYIKHSSGIGFLNAMVYATKDYDIYPVVNAQLLSVVNFPALTEENDEVFEELYNRTLSNFNQGLVWPNLISVTEKSGFRISCFLTPQMDYSDGDTPSEETLEFYLKQLKEQNAEAGLSYEMLSATSLKEKIERDRQFLESVERPYNYSSLFADEESFDELVEELSDPQFQEIQTIVTSDKEQEDLFHFCTDTISVQRTTGDAIHYTFSDDIRMKAYQTAVCYSNTVFDLTDVIFPEDEEDQWHRVSARYSSTLGGYWKNFEVYDRLTASESDVRVRKFLALDAVQERKGDTLTVQFSSFREDAWLMLRLHGEQIAEISGGTYVQAEKEAYLIHAESDTVTIMLEEPQRNDFEMKERS